MKYIRKLMYDNNMSDIINGYIPGSEYSRLAGKAQKASEQLEKTLTAEQYALFLTYCEAREEQYCLGVEEYFCDGFRLGMRLTAEGLIGKSSNFRSE